ncbi:hypothetical protein B7495_10950 [Cryobacterium sp. LW097]|uniref:hypothetical protein n=1 Tax=Cryobacterium sp. LW097 TaxID=1978566 RepID=UPI000B4D123C|nr:hypothetical protein [Cryobacterium sp. LW097]ASD22540.1 hypothetical protein B7495_10950 [Cryobacterium sp. LW097]
MSGTDLGDNDQTRKDTSYSPASETETQAKQTDAAPSTLDPEIADKVNVAPGTGGPDDVGDVAVNEEDINLPPFGETVEPPD